MKKIIVPALIVLLVIIIEVFIVKISSFPIIGKDWVLTEDSVFVKNIRTRKYDKLINRNNDVYIVYTSDTTIILTR